MRGAAVRRRYLYSRGLRIAGCTFPYESRRRTFYDEGEDFGRSVTRHLGRLVAQQPGTKLAIRLLTAKCIGHFYAAGFFTARAGLYAGELWPASWGTDAEKKFTATVTITVPARSF